MQNIMKKLVTGLSTRNLSFIVLVNNIFDQIIKLMYLVKEGFEKM